MRYKTIGSDKTLIPAIGVGCMGFGGYFTADTSTDQEAVRILHLAFDHGMTLVDTAEVYAAGHSEELVGKAIKDRRHKVYVATKVSPENLGSNDLIAAAESSLKRLQTDYIDLYQIHWPNPKISLEESIGTLELLVRQGKIRHIGFSNFSLRELRIARGCLKKETMAAVQTEYNLFDRSIEKDLLPYCHNENITLIAYCPLDQGNICGGPRCYQMLAPLAEYYDCSVAQLALAWLIQKPGVVVIPKALKQDHVIANAMAGDIKLSDEVVEEIGRLTAKNLIEIPIDRIRVADDASTQRRIYRTLEEARANIHGFAPSPAELADDMRSGELLKAVRVRKINKPSASYDYELIEGRIRYWAWVIAFEGKRDIPVLIRE
jgi:aryl-alcohol dehydrogenase-like predicted oxidoreductase